MNSPSFDIGRRRWLGSLALAVPGLSGCAAFDYRADDAPEALAELRPLQPAPRLALVLGSGGPRGYAHIGVLRVLEEAGLRPDLVVGSSVGSLIGVFWASGLDAAEIDRRSMLARKFHHHQVGSLVPWRVVIGI